MDKYQKIVKILCDYKGISDSNLIEILADQNLKYILFLLLKKYKCINGITGNNDNVLKNKIHDKKYINYNYKRAKEKFFVNKDFRELYFEMDDRIIEINEKQFKNYKNKCGK